MRMDLSIVQALWLVLIPALVCAGPGPHIRFVSHEHDFGDVIQGEAPTFEFSYTNSGDSDLLVDRIAASCGCTRAVRGKPTLKPGESAKISAQVNTFGMYPGKHGKTLVVHSNDPDNPAVALKLHFNVVRHVSLHPETLSTSLPAWDKPAVFVISATNHGNRAVTLKPAASDGPIDVLLEPREVLIPPKGKADFQIKVSVSGRPERPYLSGKLYIDSTAKGQTTLSLKYLIWLPKAQGT